MSTHSAIGLNDAEAAAVAKRLSQLQDQVHRGMAYVEVVRESLSEDEEYNRRQVLIDAYEILDQAAATLDLALLRRADTEAQS